MKRALLLTFLLFSSIFVSAATDSTGGEGGGSDPIDRIINDTTNIDCGGSSGRTCPSSFSCVAGKCVLTDTCSSDDDCLCCPDSTGSGCSTCRADGVLFYICESSACVPRNVENVIAGTNLDETYLGEATLHITLANSVNALNQSLTILILGVLFVIVGLQMMQLRMINELEEL